MNEPGTFLLTALKNESRCASFPLYDQILEETGGGKEGQTDVNRTEYQVDRHIDRQLESRAPLCCLQWPFLLPDSEVLTEGTGDGWEGLQMCGRG